MDACADESMYLFEESENTPTAGLLKTPSSSSSVRSKSHRRKRLRENLAQLAHEGELETPPVIKNRRSTIDKSHLLLNGSCFDATAENTVIGSQLVIFLIPVVVYDILCLTAQFHNKPSVLLFLSVKFVVIIF